MRGHILRRVRGTSIADGCADVGVLVLGQRIGGQVFQHFLQHWLEPRQLELLLVLPCIPVLCHTNPLQPLKREDYLADNIFQTATNSLLCIP